METFIERLKDFDSELYFQSLILIANSDGNVAPAERIFIESQAKLLEVNIENFWQQENKKININKEMSRQNKLVLLRDLIVLGYIDGNFGSTEKDRVLTIAQQLSIDASEVDALEKWLLEYWKIIEKGESLLGFSEM